VIRFLWSLVVILALVAVVGWPLVATVIEATRPEVATGLESREIVPTSRPGEIVRPLGLAFQTARLVLATEAIGLPLGIALAFVLFRTDVWGRRGMLGVVALAAFVPMPLIATAWMGALGNAGRSQALGLGIWLEGWPGAAFIHAMGCLPWVVAIVGVGLRGVEPDLEESARLDLSPWGVVWRVTLRRSLGAIAAGALAVLVLTAGDMSVTDLFSVRTYAEESYTQYQSGNSPRAAAVALPPLFAFGLLILVGVRGLLKVDPAKVISASSRSRDWRLGGWRVPLGLVLIATLGNLVALPIFSLVWHAGHVVEAGQAHWRFAGLVRTLGSTTAELFANGLTRPLRAPMVSSVLLSGIAASLTVVLAWSLAWLARKPGVWRWVTALVVAYQPFREIYDSPLLVILAYMLRTLPYAVLILWPSVRSLPEGYLEAASLEGYGPLGQARRVAIPLTLGAILASWGVAFALGLGELPAALHRGVESHLAGMGLILLAVVAVAGSLAAWGLRRWNRLGMGRDD
jgi:iron(III) transport system permease protein